MIKKVNKKFILTAALVAVLSFMFISAANAGLDLGTSYVADLGLGTQDLRATVAGIIRNALAFLGVVAVVVILYGGFVWMTAAGDAGKVDSAKNILRNGSIGLGIILSAYAITTFVFSVLLGGTTGGPGGFTGGGGNGGPSITDDNVTKVVTRGCPDPNPSDPSPYICKLKKNTSKVGSLLTVQGGLGGVRVDDNGDTIVEEGSIYFVTLDYVEDPNASALILSEEVLLPKFEDSTCESSGKCIKAQIQSCGDSSTWADNEVVVEVPDLSTLGSEYYVVVKSKLFGNADGLSLEKDTRKKNTQGVIDLSLRRNDRFTLASGTPGPGIICLVPNTGKVGDPVQILGKRFGESDGADSFITFASNIQTDSATTDENGNIVSSWTDTEIKTYVPAGAQTGDLSVTSDGVESDNDKLFIITCPYTDKTKTSECVSGCCSENMCVAARYCRGQEGDSCTTDSDCDEGLMCSSNGRCVPVESPEAGEACGVIEQNFCSNQVTCAVGNICNTDPNSSAFCTCDPIPVILDVEPKDGAPGSFVTIYGLNFGIYGTNSKVEFLGDPNDSSDDKVATPPEICGPASDFWETDSVLVEIPVGAVDGPIRITTHGGQSDSTSNSNTQGIVMNILPNEEEGEFYGFDVNEVKRPKLCYLTSAEDATSSTILSEGYFRDEVNFVGAELSVATVESDPYISGSKLPGSFSIATVPNTELQVLKGASVPNLKPLNSPYRAQVKVGDLYSNTVPFIVRSTDELPHIDYIDITRGPKGQYVSVFGGGFGNTPGTLTFDPEFGDTVTGVGTGLLFDFPQTCSLDSVWTDSNIIFTVPKDDSIRAGDATISVTNSSGLSNPQEQNAIFEICDLGTDCKLTPGICAIEPNQGPAGTRVKIFGNGLGEYVESISNVIFYNTQTTAKNSINLSSIAQYWTKDFVGKDIDSNDPDGVFVSVPSAAVSGPVYLETAQEVPDGDDEDTLPDLTSVNSSSVNFIVSDCRNESICSQTEVCCAFSGICMTEEQARVTCKPNRNDPSKLAYEYETGAVTSAPGIPMVLEDATCEPGPQSPSPFKSSTGNCKNAVISARFVNAKGVDVPMPSHHPIVQKDANGDVIPNIPFQEHFNQNTIIVVNCGTSNEFNRADCDLNSEGLPNDSTKRVAAAQDGIRPIAASTQADVVSGFEYIPAQELPLNTWFLVRLISGASAIRSEAGLWLDGNRNGVPEVNDHYEYAFKTGNDPIACAVSKVNILPDRVEVNVLDSQVTYTATAMAQNCNILNAYGFNWDWYSKKQDGNDACLASTPNAEGRVACVTNSDLAPVNAETGETDTRKDPEQVVTSVGQGIALIGAQAYQLVGTEYQPIVPKDDNNRFIVDLNIPFIQNIFHNNGFIHPLVDSIVTITGYNFGESKLNSKVFFGQSEANLAQCVNSWNDSRIQVVAPKPSVTLGDGQPIFDINTADGVFRGELTDNEALFAYSFNTSSKVEALDLVKDTHGVIENGENIPSAVNGGAISFNATGFIQIPSANLDTDKGALEFWFYALTSEEIGSQNIPDQILVKAGELSITLHSDGSLSTEPDNFVTEAAAVTRGEWHHLAYSVEGEERRVYLDGMAVIPNTGNLSTTYFLNDVSESEFIYFGGAPALEGLRGAIDNIAVYKKALTSEQVMEHAGIRKGKAALLKLSFEGEGPAFEDESVQSEFVISESWPSKTEGYFGLASKFDAGSAYSYAQTNNENIYNSTSGMSVVVWAKELSLNGNSQIFGSSLDGGLSLSVGDGTVCGSAHNLCLSAKVLIDGAPSTIFSRVNLNDASVDFDNNEWNLFIGILDLQSREIKLYVNGGFYDETENTVKPNHVFTFGSEDAEIILATKNPSAPVCIGSTAKINGDVYSCAFIDGANNSSLTAILDQLQVYNYALTSKAVGDLSGVLKSSSVYVSTNGGSTKEDRSHIFEKSENIYPFLCRLSPSSGPQGASIKATGVNFGSGRTVNFEGRNYSLNSNLFYDTLKLVSANFQSWANNLVSFKNPYGDQPVPKRDISISIDPYSEPFDDKNDDGVRDTGEDFVDVQTKRLGVNNTDYNKASYLGDDDSSQASLVSNTQPFYFAPVVTALSPDNGPIGQWVTVIGYNFGERRDAFTNELIPGKVYFTGTTGLVEAELVIDSCTGEFSWTNKAIIVEVPQGAVPGPVIVESAGDGTPESKLQSNGYQFTVNEKPLGPGISCLNPNTILKGENVLIKGVRFGATGDANNVKVDGTQNLGTLVGPWSDALNVQTDENLSYGSHIVQVVQKAKIGESCAGFSIGTFCPGGRVDVIDDIPSNGLPLTISQICQDGLLTQSQGVSNGWPQVVKNPANNAIIPTGLTATDGDYVYTLSNNIIYRMGTGLGGTTRGQVNKFDFETGQALASAKSFFFTQENLYANLDHDSLYKITLNTETNKFTTLSVNTANLYEAEWGGAAPGASTDKYFVTSNGNQVVNVSYASSTGVAKKRVEQTGQQDVEVKIGEQNVGTCTTQTSTSCNVSDGCAGFLCDRYDEISSVNTGCTYTGTCSRRGSCSVYYVWGGCKTYKTEYYSCALSSTITTTNKSCIKFTYETRKEPIYSTVDSYGGYTVQILNPSSNFTQAREFFIPDSTDFTQAELLGVVADTKYIYLLSKSGKVRLIDIATGDFAKITGTNSNLEWNSETQKESNGQFDIKTGNFYLGTFDNSGNIYRYRGCDFGQSCQTDADCNACGLGTSSCVAGVCTPVITEITPSAAAVGQYVTVQGCYLDGDSREVCFTKAGADAGADCSAGFIPATDVPESICGALEQRDDYIVVEVPQLDQPTNSSDNDAQDGPIQVVINTTDNDGNALKLKVQSFDTTSVVPTQNQIDSIDPYYSFGVNDFDVNNSIIQPSVCSLTPNEGDVGALVEVRGKGFGETLTIGEDKVTFKGDETSILDDQSTNMYFDSDGTGDAGTCGGTIAGWSENLICTYVPQGATTGAVEVTNDNIESVNGIPFTLYETIKGPQKVSSVPESDAENVCTNSIIEVTFTGFLDESTIQDNIRLHKCTLESQTLARGFGGRVVKFFKVIKDLVLHQTFAQDSAYLDCDTDVRLESVTTRFAGGQTVVSIKPKLFLDGGSLFRVSIGDGIKDASGLLINREISIHTDETRVERALYERNVVIVNDVNSTSVDIEVEKGKVVAGDILTRGNGERMKVKTITSGTNTDLLNVERAYYRNMGGDIAEDENVLVDDDFTFRTKGVSGQLNSGVCTFDDVEVSVYNDSNSSGEIATKDFFVCAGENCRLPFDYDQAPGPLADGPSYDLNQHRYIARATSGVNDSTTFVDQFERTNLNQGDNSFVQGSCDKFIISNGKLENTGGCGVNNPLLISSDGAVEPKLFPRGTATKIEVELNSNAQDYGVYIGGNYVYRTNFFGELRYIASNQLGGQFVSDPVPSFPTFSRWEVTLMNGKINLVVDGQKVLPNTDNTYLSSSIVFNNNGYHGLFSTASVAQGKAIWDNLRVSVESYNVLRGKYTWSRSEQLDPLKLVTLLPQIKGGTNQDLLPDDADKVQSEGGEVYSQIEPVVTGQTKIVVEASTDAGQASNTISKEFPINVFICENPWPNYNEQFTDNALNFLTYYCRDVGDAKDPVGNLPPAGTIQRCDYRKDDPAYNEAQCEDYGGIPRACSEAGVCYPPIR